MVNTLHDNVNDLSLNYHNYRTAIKLVRSVHNLFPTRHKLNTFGKKKINCCLVCRIFVFIVCWCEINVLCSILFHYTSHNRNCNTVFCYIWLTWRTLVTYSCSPTVHQKFALYCLVPNPWNWNKLWPFPAWLLTHWLVIAVTFGKTQGGTSGHTRGAS